ncbi:AraC family transcriptional regulator [Pseudomonas sp. GM17]|uniref:AraC family transcriptional regulator n=1 Tax=Pseudomonas sp. GM17 TaxID=1144323 RepID=UPI0002E698D5|nr:AraC family transcriptional regulator [Pseudomonas sp. GM17]WIE48282.1 AraC family transcriptional regulator ligand-binding domain-containing protein [Pseudomonas sp. GM17]
MDSVRGTAFLQYGELLAVRGASMREYLTPHHIDLGVVGNYERTCSYKSLVHIFEGSAHALHMPEFGMELASRQRTTLLGPLHYLAQSAPTVGDALVAVIRYMHVYSQSIHFSLERRHGQALLCFKNALGCNLVTPQIVEKSVLQGSLLIAELLSGPFQPKTVLFRHLPQASQAIYQSYFNCPVLFSQEHNVLVLHAEDLQRPCVQFDPVLHDIMRFYLEANCSANRSLHDQVAQKIQMLLPRQRCSLDQVAVTLGLNPRTLQRHLAEDGIEFEQLVDRTRRQQARQLLTNTALSVAQIAQELGYRRTTSFCRAHLRWFACTPLEHRLQQMPNR